MQKFLTFLILFLLSGPFFSQAQIDSLLARQFEKQDTFLFNHYTEIIKYYFRSDLEKAAEYVDKQLKLAELLDLPEKTVYARNIYGVLHSKRSEYERAKEIFEEVMAMYEEMGNRERVSAMLNNIAICNSNLGQTQLAIENHMEALRIKEEIGASQDAIAASYWNLGNVHWEVLNSEESTAYYRRALIIYEELNDESSAVEIKDNIAANLLANPDSLDVVMAIYEDCMAFYKKNNYLIELAGTYEAMGNLRLNQDRFEEAKKYYQQALEIAESAGEKRFPGILYRRMAKVNRKLNNKQEALAFAQKALDNAQELGLQKKEINDHKELAEIYQAMGRYEDALESYKAYHARNDTILSNDKLLAIEELETKYQTEKKEKEIELLKERDRINQLKQKGLIGSVFGLGLLLFSLFYGFRQRMKRSKAEQARLNQEVEFTQRELDFKKQELTSFALQLAQKNELLEKLKTDVRNIATDDQEKRKLQSIVNTIHISQSDEENWESFHARFREVHIDFDQKVRERYPKVTSNDLRMLALMRMNLSSKEISNVLNVSTDAIKKARYRLRKKMELDSEVNLEELVMEI